MAVDTKLSPGARSAGGGTIADGFLQIQGGVPLDTTLRTVTDKVGTASPLQLSTTQVGVTGPVQTGTGSLYKPFRIGYSNSTISVTDLDLISVGATANGAGRYSTVMRLGGGSDTALHYIYAGDNSTSTGIILNRTNGATGIFASGGVLIGDSTFAGSGAASARLHVRGDGANPIQVWQNAAGVDQVVVSSTGDFSGGNAIFYGTLQGVNYVKTGAGGSLFFDSRSVMTSPVDGNLLFRNQGGTSFNLLQLGGTTNAFPAIKRNGAAIDFRLADDSGYCNVNAGTIVSYAGSNFVQVNSSGIIFSGGTADIANDVSGAALVFKTNSGAGRTERGRFEGNGDFKVLNGIIAAGLPTTRPATVGAFYQDTAANILANGDKVVGIRQ
jgi:hypothetical protein